MDEEVAVTKHREIWRKSKEWETLSTEDQVSWASGAKNIIVTRCGTGSKIVDLDSGAVLGKIDPEEDPVLATACLVDKTDHLITYTAHKSGLVRRFEGPEFGEGSGDAPVTIKADHRGPILHLLTLKNGRFLVTVGSDFLLKVWDPVKRHCVGILRGLTSVPACVGHLDLGDKSFVACGLVDGSIKVWTVKEEEDGPVCTPSATTLTKHNSQIACLTFPAAKGKSLLVACGRDKLMSIWDLETNSCVNLVATLEEVEAISNIDNETAQNCWKKAKKSGIKDECSYCLLAGEKGKVRLWNITSGLEVDLGSSKVREQFEAGGKITDLNVNKENKTLNFIQDDVITIFNLESGERNVTSVNQHEVLDFSLVGESKMVIATNTNNLRIYDFISGKTKITNAINGHSDAILAVASVKRIDAIPSPFFVSCGKDQAVCVWRIKDDEPQFVAKGVGHTSYVGAVAMTSETLFSASKSGIIKSWSMPREEGEVTDESLKTKRSVQAHNMGINSLDVHHDGSTLISGSQDKTVKLWRTNDLALLGTLTGHRRGVWSCKFFHDGSKVLIATGSGDATIKIWDKNAFSNYSCIQTLEGHLASVLSIAGMDNHRICSVGSDGLLKVWGNNLSQEVGSFDAHDDKIWAVECYEDKIVTGGRDGQVAIWENVTAEVQEQEKAKQDDLIRTDQKLSNYLNNGQFSKALKIALKLDRPRAARGTLTKLQADGKLRDALLKLNIDERNKLHGMVVKWNSFGSQCALAQDILKVLLVESIANNQKISAAECSGLIAFSEKHYERIGKLHSRLAVVDLLLDNM